MSGYRSKSRELLLQILFCSNFNQINQKYKKLIDDFEEEFMENDCDINMKFLNKEYCLNVLNGIDLHRDEIDNLIQNNLKRWKINRIAKIDLSILRLAVYEMCFDGLPPKIAINEALNLTKTYSVEKSKGYINGVLDSIKKSREDSINET
ncbi:transcription antitermination factor NusB [Candidatus Arthromitus sp. SFB-rat-Yit]|uniref:transcription antitermination factor NusB n=1 Tax=Candidatus Arthromitus sp. SFB-rat-Yit TaxID=1041504 RepID=UPI000227A6D7|nr:transcription antitermination factor NusB [Candidatus Arthromitus sp. SFB-rat-Yit]BAK81110.1 transcription antitermination protein NusB [Candidatus Arthromitus sp. SFB-rat-Yit]